MKHELINFMFYLVSLAAVFWMSRNAPPKEGALRDIQKTAEREIIGPFIRGKIRRELYHLYEHVLSKTRTARIDGSRLISVLDSFSCKCCP